MLDYTRRLALVQAALFMNKTGLNQGTSGNISLRTNEGFLITPSALAYDRCLPADIVELTSDGQVISGTGKPSSEWRLHRDIYTQREEAGAVFHAHPPWCTTLACLEQDIPAFHYMVAMAGGDSITCAPYAVFGSAELSENVLAELANGHCACLLAHHGMICFSSDLQGVLDLAMEIENLARVYVQALQVGPVPVLSQKEMQVVHKSFKEYKRQA